MINKSEESTRTTAAGQIEWDSKIASLDIKGNHRQAFPLTISQAEWHTFVGFCADSVHTLLTVFPKTIFAPIKRQQFSTQMQKTEKMQKGGGDTKKKYWDRPSSHFIVRGLGWVCGCLVIVNTLEKQWVYIKNKY